jgi:uncharacterized membrane protein
MQVTAVQVVEVVLLLDLEVLVEQAQQDKVTVVVMVSLAVQALVVGQVGQVEEEVRQMEQSVD